MVFLPPAGRKMLPAALRQFRRAMLVDAAEIKLISSEFKVDLKCFKMFTGKKKILKVITSTRVHIVLQLKYI